MRKPKRSWHQQRSFRRTTRTSSRPQDEIPGAQIVTRSFVAGRSVSSVLFVYGNGARELLRRDATQSANLARNHLLLTYTIRIGSTLAGEIRAMDEIASPRRSRLFHRVQHASGPAPLGARKEHPAFDRDRTTSDLDSCGAIRRPDRGFSRTITGQGSRRRKLVADFHS